MYKIINWYTKRFPFPYRGWKFVRSFLQDTGLYNRSFCKKLHNGTRMYVRPSEHIQQQLFWYGHYEKDAILTWEKFIEHGAIVLDIGANAGYYSLIAASKALAVYAFEPAGPLVEELRNNILLNKFSNIHVAPIAVGAKSGETNLYLSGNDNTGMTSLAPPENFSGQTVISRITTLDQWIAEEQLAKIDCIKMDVEGAEMDILTGAAQTLLQYKPVIFIEVIAELLSRFNYSPSDIFRFFSRNEYTGYEIESPGLLRILIEPKEAYNVIFLPKGFKMPAGTRVI